MEYSNLFFVIGISIIILISSPIAYAQESVKGKISTLSYIPEEPVVTEGITITVGVENPDNVGHEYNLKMVIIKDGRIKSEEEFTFKLGAGRQITFSPTYIPDDIGEFEIVAKLYEKFEINLLSSKLEKFNAVSHIGPFDLEVSIPTDVGRPNIKIPIITKLINMGEKGTDVEVKLTMPCLTKVDSAEKFVVFLNPKQSLKKITSITSCPEEGLHDILGEIILFNKTWISSTSQIFLNTSYIELLVNVPESFVLGRGESKVFDLPVTNLGNKAIHNLQVIVGTLPQDWIKITPASVMEVEPQETAIFIANITVPKDAEETVYDFGISAAADETLVRKQTQLQIVSLAIARKLPEIITPAMPEIKLPTISQNIIYLVLLPVGLVASIFVINSINRTKVMRQRYNLLNKLRFNIIESSRKGIKKL